MNRNASSSNARWSAFETSARGKSSDRLRKLLYQQDLGRGEASATRLDSSAHTMPMPAVRRTSFDSLNSLGSMSSLSSMSSIGSARFTIRKNSSSKLLRYHNKDSMNSLLSRNSRWKSTPPKKRNSTSSSSSKLLRSSILSPNAVGNHSGRWMATVSSDSAMDRPISAIRRKASLNTIMPSSS